MFLRKKPHLNSIGNSNNAERLHQSNYAEALQQLTYIVLECFRWTNTSMAFLNFRMKINFIREKQEWKCKITLVI